MPRLVNELWVQLYSLYIMYPGTMAKYMPTAHDFVERVNMALQNVDADNASMAYNAPLASALNLNVPPSYLTMMIAADIARRGGLLNGNGQAG